MLWFVLALGSAVFKGLTDVLSKEALTKEGALDFSTALSLTVVVISIPLLVLIDFDLSFSVFSIIFASALTASLGFYLTALCLKYLDISIVSPFRNFSPAILAVMAFFVLGEKLRLLQLIGISILIIGSYVLEIDFKKHDLLSPFKEIVSSKYMLLLILSLFFYSLSAIAGKKALSFTGPFTVMFFNQFFIALIFLVYLTGTHSGFKGVKRGFDKAWWLVVLIAVLTVSYRILQYKAMAIAFVSLVIPIKRLSTLFSTVIGGEFFHERGLIHKSVACVIMIAGAVLVALG